MVAAHPHIDPTGNWTDFWQDDNGDGTWDLKQQRDHNMVNEIDTDEVHGDADNPITENPGAAWADPVYDAAGNMTTVPKPAALTAGMALKYDAWNRLMEAKVGQTVLTRYEYEGLNRRTIEAPTYSGTTYYLHLFWNSGWQTLAMRYTTTADAQPESLSTLLQYVWSARYIDAQVLRYKSHNGERIYCLCDANFNVTTLVDTSGDALEHYQYAPYGKLTVLNGGTPDTDGAEWTADPNNASDVANEYFYTGRRSDRQTCFYYYRNRYYHAELGRFLSRDPIGAPNLYLYVGANPVADLDPYGLLSRKACEKKLDGLKKHIQQLEDHDSEGHCNSLRSVLDMFVSGGCRKWAKSFKERLDELEDFYRKKCEDPDDDSDDKCPDPTPGYYYGTPFSGLQNMVESLGKLIGLDLSGIPVIAAPMPLPASPIRPVPTIPPGVRVPAGASPLPSIHRPAWSVLENPERDFQNKLPFAPLPDEAGPGSDVPGWYSEAMDKWGATGEKPPPEFFQRLDEWQAKHPRRR